MSPKEEKEGPKGTPSRAIAASYTYTPTLPANGALPGHSVFHLYHHPAKKSSSSSFLFQTVPVYGDASTSAKAHLASLANPSAVGLSYSTKRAGSIFSSAGETINFYKGPLPDDPSAIHRADITMMHGGGVSKFFDLRREITFHPPAELGEKGEKLAGDYEQEGKMQLEEVSKNFGTSLRYKFTTPETQIPLYWKDTEISTPDPTRPEKDERDRFFFEGHMSCIAAVDKTRKGEPLRENEEKGIIVARFVKPIDSQEKVCYWKMGRVEFVWEGCERVWGPGWDDEDVVESILSTVGLVAVLGERATTTTVPV
ncbi:hypothetical protein DFP72DRAFT_881431 [Ephemerocybe angulata]|uniref:Uncharacterized protein n=1 Tax=Ephemerocybe angulata TaxID=980116 RepID=A0A8H6MCF5_9AGAR|nr:hypothetical protein DFP72DRAFT_881431 [Tulosesus angulatus]